MTEFWAAIKQVPALVALAERLVLTLEWACDLIRNRLALKEFDLAVEKSEKEKDPSDLDKVFGG